MLQVNSIHKNWFIVQFSSVSWKPRADSVYPMLFLNYSLYIHFSKVNYLDERNVVLFEFYWFKYVRTDHIKEMQNLAWKRTIHCEKELLHCEKIIGMQFILTSAKDHDQSHCFCDMVNLNYTLIDNHGTPRTCSSHFYYNDSI